MDVRLAGPGILLLCLGVGITCGGEPGASSREHDPGRDGGPPAGGSASVVLVGHGGDTVRLPAPATRIVSLVPSATEALLRLGAAERLVGRTDFDSARVLSELPSVGGGLQPNLEILRTLEPDLVVSFAGESDTRTARVLGELDIPVLGIRPSGIDDVRHMILQMGDVVGSPDAARAMVDGIDRTLDDVRGAVAGLSTVRIVYLLGGTPPLAAGPDTFLSQLVEVAGGRNVLDDLGALYAPVSPEVLVDRGIDAVLMSEGSRVDERILQGRRAITLPNGVEIPGPDVGASAWLVARALHPELADSVR